MNFAQLVIETTAHEETWKYLSSQNCRAILVLSFLCVEKHAGPRTYEHVYGSYGTA